MLAGIYLASISYPFKGKRRKRKVS